MHSPPVVLAADDQPLGMALQARVGALRPLEPPLCPFAAVREHLGPFAPQLLICAAVGADDAAAAVRLVQEVRLRGFPAAVVAVEAGACASDQTLACLDPFIDRRLCWPTDADALLDLLPSWSAILSAPAPPSSSVAARLAQTPALLPLVGTIALAAAHDVTVLLRGETGTGKTFLARLIHESSSRRQARLLTIPCGALAPNLVESELFGHVRGAFTGADRFAVGKFEAAGDGTILLDEVDALSLEQQVKLLRVVETGEFEPVGSNETRLRRARVIAASNIDLEQAVAKGKFRQDLYYRLSVLTIPLPPLRERVADIGPLARGLAARLNAKFGKGLYDISAEALALLESFSWPGNVRQLENTIQRAVLASRGPVLLPEHLPAFLRRRDPDPLLVIAGPLTTDLDQHEKRAVEQALAEAGYVRSRAARALGVCRATLYNKMKKHGIVAPQRLG